MIWSMDMDDFRGSCMGLPFPLIHSAKEELKGYKVANLESSSSNNLKIQVKIGEFFFLHFFFLPLSFSFFHPFSFSFPFFPSPFFCL